MSIIKISALNPIQFHQYGVGDFAYNLVPSIEFQKGYNQVYFAGDRPGIQLLSDMNVDLQIQVVDINDTLIDTWHFDLLQTTYGAYNVYQCNDILPSTPGIYFIKIVVSHNDELVTFYNEPINLVASADNVLSIEYTHDQNEFDVLFLEANVFNFFLRIEGGIRSEGLAPGGKFTMFQDLVYKSVMLQSQPFNVEKFIFGPGDGVPNWMADKLNRIFGLSTVMINGVQYSRNEGAKMERIGDTGYPLAGWSLDLIKTENPYGNEVDTAETFLASNGVITASTGLYTASNNLL